MLTSSTLKYHYRILLSTDFPEIILNKILKKTIQSLIRQIQILVQAQICTFIHRIHKRDRHYFSTSPVSRYTEVPVHIPYLLLCPTRIRKHIATPVFTQPPGKGSAFDLQSESFEFLLSYNTSGEQRWEQVPSLILIIRGVCIINRQKCRHKNAIKHINMEEPFFRIFCDASYSRSHTEGFRVPSTKCFIRPIQPDASVDGHGAESRHEAVEQTGQCVAFPEHFSTV